MTPKLDTDPGRDWCLAFVVQDYLQGPTHRRSGHVPHRTCSGCGGSLPEYRGGHQCEPSGVTVSSPLSHTGELAWSHRITWAQALAAEQAEQQGLGL